jgi:hypothetical protein
VDKYLRLYYEWVLLSNQQIAPGPPTHPALLAPALLPSRHARRGSAGDTAQDLLLCGPETGGAEPRWTGHAPNRRRHRRRCWPPSSFGPWPPLGRRPPRRPSSTACTGVNLFVPERSVEAFLSTCRLQTPSRHCSVPEGSKTGPAIISPLCVSPSHNVGRTCQQRERSCRRLECAYGRCLRNGNRQHVGGDICLLWYPHHLLIR